MDEDDKLVKDTIPCGFVFDLSGMEHYKSVAFPDITTIVFDEFMARRGYLPNEFELFQNVLSTIIRLRDNVKILMLADVTTNSAKLCIIKVFAKQFVVHSAHLFIDGHLMKIQH